MRAGGISLVCALLGLLALAGRESAAVSPPLVDSVTMPAGSRQQADAAMLAAGRALFVVRCARCHTLPKVAAHSAAQWPGLVAKMAKRSGLKPAQLESVLTYILHQRKQG